MILKMQRHSLCILVICLCWAIVGIRSARCQEFTSAPDEGAVIFGYTSIDYDPQTSVVTAYSETDVYYPYYYFVTTQLTSSGCGGSASSRIETTVAVQCSFQGSEGNTYTAYGYHTVGFIVDTDDGYEDPDGLSYWPEYDIESPWQFPFTSTGDGSYSDTESTEVGSTYDTAETTIPASCGTNDQRNTIIAEYETYGSAVYPSCGYFTQNTGDPTYTFTLLNSGMYSWAIIRPYLISELHSLADLTSFTINSGYRNPAKEIQLDQQLGSKPYPNSRHVYGDAVDLAAGTQPQWTTYQTDGWSLGACVEPAKFQGTNGKPSYAHAHLIDWRTNSAALNPSANCPPLYGPPQ